MFCCKGRCISYTPHLPGPRRRHDGKDGMDPCVPANCPGCLGRYLGRLAALAAKCLGLPGVPGTLADRTIPMPVIPRPSVGADHRWGLVILAESDDKSGVFLVPASATGTPPPSGFPLLTLDIRSHTPCGHIVRDSTPLASAEASACFGSLVPRPQHGRSR